MILACSYLFLFYNLGSYSLKEPDEGRYAEIPREMVEQGDYVVPHLDYVRYFEKPPLLYWITALSYKTFGISEWSFRFPNALAALLCILTMYLSMSNWFGEETGLISSLILLGSFGFFAISHIVTIDMLFSFLLFVCLLCFYQYYREKGQLFLYLFFAALALAVLAKGPVAFILLMVTIVIFLWSEKRLPFLRNILSIKALLLFCVIVLPWFIIICLREKEFFQFFFIDQHILRFLTTKHKRSGPLYYFFPVLFGGLFPWSIFIPRAAAELWREKELRLFFIWSLVVFVFFSLSGSKLPPYILPIFPAVSVILANLFWRRWHQRITPKRELIIYGIFFSCVALTGLAHGTGMLDKYLANLSEIAAVSRAVRWLTLSASIASLAILIVMSFRMMRTYRSLFFTLGAFCLVLFTGIMLHSHVIDGLNTTKELAREINKTGNPAPVVIDFGSFDETLPFYLKRRTYIAEYFGELKMGSEYPDAKDHFLDKESFAKIFRSDRPVFVVLKAKRFSWLEATDIEGGTLIAHHAKRQLIANRAAALSITGTHVAPSSGKARRDSPSRS
ncbi:MAG: glycosyltransferase family 39 protein [Syntrophorhabdaceae bacterium]|nr:glycosyltransferase family 39 protein [Syntrophorhabdaceae bacterium]